MKPRHPPRRERGIALIAVLALVGLLVILAAGLVENTRRHDLLSRRAFDAVQMNEVLDGALRLTLLELAFPQHATQQSNIAGRTVLLFDVRIETTIELESGRIDLNFASPQAIQLVLIANGISAEAAKRLVDEIQDWRDVDDVRSEAGAERADYSAKGLPGPRNGAFETISELRRLHEGATLPDSVLDAFTVYSHSPTVNARFAVPQLRRAFDLARSEAVSELGDPTVAPSSERIDSLAGHTVRIRACASATKVSRCRMVIARLTGSTSTPWETFFWGNEGKSRDSVPRQASD